jgi:hypothetical protein
MIRSFTTHYDTALDPVMIRCDSSLRVEYTFSGRSEDRVLVSISADFERTAAGFFDDFLAAEAGLRSCDLSTLILIALLLRDLTGKPGDRVGLDIDITGITH